MTNFTAEPDGFNIKIGHNIYEEELGNYFVVTRKKNFEASKEQALTAAQKISSIQLTELKSSESEIYWIDNIILRNSVKLWMQFRDVNLFGTNKTEYIDSDMSNIVSPFNLNAWFYNYTPTMDIQENATLAVTAVTKFSGIIFSVKKYNTSIEADKQIIEDIKAGKVRCWHIRA